MSKKKIFCRECGTFRPVVGYQRDNPVLTCGHVKDRNIVDDRVNNCRNLLEKLLGPKDTGSLKHLLAASLRNYSEFTDFCPVCGTVVCVIVDQEGVRRCHGNLLTRPGCFSSLGTVQHTVQV
jgi:hypothetical protein